MNWGYTCWLTYFFFFLILLICKTCKIFLRVETVLTDFLALFFFFFFTSSTPLLYTYNYPDILFAWTPYYFHFLWKYDSEISQDYPLYNELSVYKIMPQNPLHVESAHRSNSRFGTVVKCSNQIKVPADSAISWIFLPHSHQTLPYPAHAKKTSSNSWPKSFEIDTRQTFVERGWLIPRTTQRRKKRIDGKMDLTCKRNEPNVDVAPYSEHPPNESLNHWTNPLA